MEECAKGMGQKHVYIFLAEFVIWFESNSKSLKKNINF